MGNRKRVLMLASVASMIDQFNMPNIHLLIQEGYQVHVACNFEEGNTCDERRIQELKETLQQLGAWHQWDCPRNICPPGQCIRAYRQLWELTGRYHFVWMHCHSPIGGALARMVAHHRKIAVIYTAHGFHFYRGAPFWNWLLYYPVEKLLAYWTDALITVNREDYCMARKNLKAGKVFYIPGVGIDLRKFQKPVGQRAQITQETAGQPFYRQDDVQGFRRQYQIPEEAILLLSVGELSKRKNHQAVITALAEIEKADIYYLICGQGALQQALMRQAQTLGIAERVIMPGFLRDVAAVYQNADIFMFPSLQEGMPVALMEAMAAGMPCVVSDIRGNRDLIDRRGGKRFAVSDAGQLRDAMLYFLDRPKERAACGCYNKEKIKEYSMETVQRKMRKIYAYMKELNCERKRSGCKSMLYDLFFKRNNSYAQHFLIKCYAQPKTHKKTPVFMRLIYKGICGKLNIK